MSKFLRRTFLVHVVVALLSGIPLLLAPGRLLQFMGWAPIDPVISRLFGAALVALAWASFRGYRAAGRSQVRLVVELEALYTVLAVVGTLRHIVMGGWPWMLWLLLVVFGIFALAWILVLIREPWAEAE